MPFLTMLAITFAPLMAATGHPRLTLYTSLQIAVVLGIKAIIQTNPSFNQAIVIALIIAVPTLAVAFRLLPKINRDPPQTKGENTC